MTASFLQVAAWMPCVGTEGPFDRFAIWVQGCTLACPGCCNPEMHAPKAGMHISISALLSQLDQARTLGIEGITVLGGEPLEQLPAVTALCAGAQALDLGVVVFTGYTLTEACAREGFSQLHAVVDTFVDGRFEARAHEPLTGRGCVGSTNQRLHHLTPRYAAPALWTHPPRLEVHPGRDGSLQLVGHPALAARLSRHLANVVKPNALACLPPSANTG